MRARVAWRQSAELTEAGSFERGARTPRVAS